MVCVDRAKQIECRDQAAGEVGILQFDLIQVNTNRFS